MAWRNLQQAGLRPFVARRMRPLAGRATDGAHKHGVGLQGRSLGLLGQRRAVPVETAAAKVALIEDQVVGQPRGYPAHLVDHLRPDAVAGEE